jgi:hypothetical protein
MSETKSENMTSKGFYLNKGLRVYKFGRIGSPETGAISLHASLVDAQPGNLYCSSYAFDTEFNPGLPMYVVNTPKYYLENNNQDGLISTEATISSNFRGHTTAGNNH